MLTNIVIQSAKFQFRRHANFEFYRVLSFEFNDVLAARRRVALSERSMGVDISVRNSTAFTDALRKDSAMMVG